MYINRRQTLLIFSIFYTLLCSWLKPPLVTLRSVPHPHHTCVEGAAGCPPPAQGRGVREGVAPPDECSSGSNQGCHPFPRLRQASVPLPPRWLPLWHLHHRSINLRSLREREGGTFKSQRLTELPEARKRPRST